MQKQYLSLSVGAYEVRMKPVCPHAASAVLSSPAQMELQPRREHAALMEELVLRLERGLLQQSAPDARQLVASIPHAKMLVGTARNGAACRISVFAFVVC
jgi:hypothetical protein